MSAKQPQDFRIIVIGAGPGGMCTAIKLREAGIEDFVVLEKASGVGGTWWHNRYPGAECDVQSHLYSFSFEQKNDWSRPFAGQASHAGRLRPSGRLSPGGCETRRRNSHSDTSSAVIGAMEKRNAVSPPNRAKLRPVMSDPVVPPSAEKTTISPAIAECRSRGSELRITELTAGEIGARKSPRRSANARMANARPSGWCSRSIAT